MTLPAAFNNELLTHARYLTLPVSLHQRSMECKLPFIRKYLVNLEIVMKIMAGLSFQSLNLKENLQKLIVELKS